MPNRPLNIVYLHSHDTGRYVQPYGYAVETPRLQAFAEESVLFRNAFCVNPTCSASRTGLLTGMYPHEAGMLGLAHRGSRLTDPSRHLASFLSTHGYHTALSGVQHEARHDEKASLGYQMLLDAALSSIQLETGDDSAAARAQRYLTDRLHGDKPFFLSCGFFATHRTGKVQWHNGDEPLGEARYVRPPACLPDTPETRADFADYRVAAGRLDRYMGTVLDAIDQAGRREDTLVICTTDHGIAFPGMKCNLTDHGTGVMLMLRGPGLGGGRVIDPMVTHMDVFPTVCELIGIDKPAWLRGKSLLPLVRGEVESLHEAVYATLNFHAAYEPQRGVRTQRHRYIRRWNVLPHPVLSNVDDGASKNLLIAEGWRQRPQRAESLYDLVFDPTESCDLSQDPKYAGVLEQMRGRLDAWMKETNDPLLSGSVPARSGYILNPVDGLSPQEKPDPVP
jgi:arylsulfatase A-like enzyme